METKKNKVFIIAEAGVNHNGSVELAEKMVEIAAQAGADAIKFQTFKTELLVSKYAEKAEYQVKNSGEHGNQIDMLKPLELDWQAHVELFNCCRKNNIKFLSSPFDIESINLLEKLNLDIYKIPSGEITNLPYLRKIGTLKKKVILSTGMSELSEIKDAINVLTDSGTDKDEITLLHCNTDYPTKFEDVNLLAMIDIKEKFDIKVGYSDHTAGIEVSIAAAALGAEIIEKHFTIDKNMKGPDHIASVDPDELKNMVSAIRNIEKSMGLKNKVPTKSELKNKSIARKSIIAAAAIKKGEVFNEFNICVKRPGNGLSPMMWDKVIGQVAKQNFEADEKIII
ncbi:N-acetylneuraminate synthase [Candidatus Dependentiae bacterium]|nr:N-acetylneuraminate synthase [Candidatus Dependentiae bacterium]